VKVANHRKHRAAVGARQKASFRSTAPVKAPRARKSVTREARHRSAVHSDKGWSQRGSARDESAMSSFPCRLPVMTFASWVRRAPVGSGPPGSAKNGACLRVRDLASQ
jgi:hypothetical protein